MNCPPEEIIYVDDSPDDRLFARLTFDRGDYPFVLTILDSAASALATLEQRIANGMPLPTLLITDHYMPVIDGPELLRILRADPRLVGLTLAICSGGDDPADVSAAADAGAQLQLGKPLDLDLCRKILSGSLVPQQ
jgi:CheY-like chemotaxis protein